MIIAIDGPAASGKGTLARRLADHFKLAHLDTGKLYRAAALHATAALRPERACGLATLGLFAERRDPLPPADGRMAAPSAPGLGEGLAEWYGAAT